MAMLWTVLAQPRQRRYVNKRMFMRDRGQIQIYRATTITSGICHWPPAIAHPTSTATQGLEGARASRTGGAKGELVEAMAPLIIQTFFIIYIVFNSLCLY